MPKRTDLKKILIIGSGPIIISQACEFDYSGTQACKALKEEGFEIVLVNSNPATIMTDPEFADRTYIEPLVPEVVAKIIERERPQALLPTLGGQTALNVSILLAESGVLDRYGVELIGAKQEAIRKAEDRVLFKEAMGKIGLDLPRSEAAYSVEEAYEIAEKLGFPLIIRPAFTLGGTGGGIAYNRKDLAELVARGIESSQIGQVLLEESVIGWKEYELEVMRDLKDNVVIICSIENFDPMGIHTGDSITVAPAQTLTDREYQKMRDAAIKVMREIGVDTGGSNIQFAVEPESGRMVIIEMNPRVSRSSALASKATGFPIAKIAAKLAVGYTLDEIPNDITRYTPASFEPTIDYVVVKIPRWTFEKFPEADQTLTTQMKSVGEVMAIGRTLKEALQKGLRSLEIDRYGLGSDGADGEDGKWEFRNGRWENSRADLLTIKQKLAVPNWERIFYLKYALQAGMSIEEIYELTGIDRWFLFNLKEIIDLEAEIRQQAARIKLSTTLNAIGESLPVDSNPSISIGERVEQEFPPDLLLRAKKFGFSDLQLAYILDADELTIRNLRKRLKINAVFKMVDTCAAEFEAYTPYLYSTYEKEDEAPPSSRRKIMILGGGPNRIGQGIEFDYCCVHGAFALKEDGYEVIMVNCNPETVSTDYDTSDRLYFEPLTLEDVLNIVEKEKPEGMIVQFGGQTPLKLAVPLEREVEKILGRRLIIGTTSDSIDIAEDRKRFGDLLRELNIPQPENGTAMSFGEALVVAQRIGYPVLVRPSYVLGGRAMELVYDAASLETYVKSATKVSPLHPVLIDKFLEDAIEVDVDAVADRTGRTVIAGIMEHIEEAGIHSGDSACVLPPFSLRDDLLDKIREYTYALARALRVVGLMNIQYAIKNDVVYVLEVNPRASRTVPFVSKATGVPWAKVASRLMTGKTLEELGITREVKVKHLAVKESVFPFNRFPGVDSVLGPEMKSTGEVMGIDTDFGRAFSKSQMSCNVKFPLSGNVFISVKNKDKRAIIFIAKKLADLGFRIYATKGTGSVLQKSGLEITTVRKVIEGRPNIVDHINNGEIDLIINTPAGKGPRSDDFEIRRAAINHNILCITTISGAQAAVNGIEALHKGEITVKSIQEYHALTHSEY